MTKVPVILTATLKGSLLGSLRDSDIEYDVVHYRYREMPSLELKAALNIIGYFEGLVARLLEMDADRYFEQKDKVIKAAVVEYFKQ